MIIADTCLVFHLFNETDLTISAQKVLYIEPHWIVPPLWREEYANVLSKIARKGHRSKTDVLTLFKNTLNELSNCEIAIDTQTALEISLEYKISVYDAHFVALAIEFNTLIVTEDKEVLKRCPDISINMSNFIKIKHPTI